MIDIKQKTDCCGCTACANVCPHAAISMQPDGLGFQYPSVDIGKCVDCGLCNKVCQFNSDYDRYLNYASPIVYSVRHNDEVQLARSQSGAVFYALANHFSLDGGLVYGAAFTDNWRVRHIKADDPKKLESLRMSKYVQSDLGRIFHSVKEDLREGHKVLFSGTACQVAGLKSFVPNKLHNNLVCIDIVCHGVPSPKIWTDYIDYLEEKYSSKIVKACFRDKRFGWHGAKESFQFANGNEIFARTSNRLYFSGLSLRESCTVCHFTNTSRVGDITLGDHWGIPKDSPFEKDAKGLSLVLVNSEKGKQLFDAVRDNLFVEIIEDKSYLQPQLLHPAKQNPRHEAFVKDYERYGFLMVAKKYGDLGWNHKMKMTFNFFKRFLR